MDESVGSTQAASVTLSARELAASLPAVRSAARWFWWIAGLSLVNTVMSQTEANTSFVMGLGITAMADALLSTHKLLGFAIDALAIGFFVFMGFQAQRAKLWPFYLGVAAYALDALIYAFAEDWMPAAFHGLAIFFIVKGVMVLRSVLSVAGRDKLLPSPREL